MTFTQEQQDHIIKLLKNDAARRVYIRSYMKEYRRKKKEDTGKGQKQYYTAEDIKTLQRASYKLKTALNDIKFLFKE